MQNERVLNNKHESTQLKVFQEVTEMLLNIYFLSQWFKNSAHYCKYFSFSQFIVLNPYRNNINSYRLQ